MHNRVVEQRSLSGDLDWTHRSNRVGTRFLWLTGTKRRFHGRRVLSDPRPGASATGEVTRGSQGTGFNARIRDLQDHIEGTSSLVFLLQPQRLER